MGLSRDDVPAHECRSGGEAARRAARAGDEDEEGDGGQAIERVADVSAGQSAGRKTALENRRPELGKTRAKWQSEFEDLRRTLKKALPETGVNSHQELVSKTDISQQTINFLNRAAHVRVLVAEVDGLLASADRTLLELDQQIWKLEKKIELNNVTTPEEAAAINRALATATELVAERTSPAKREDIAAEEAKLFREIVGGSQ